MEGLARLGFGFVEVGTVTPRPQPGNPRPRLFRIPERQAIINRMGFNNQGLAAMVQRLESLRRRGRLGDTVLGVNVGKNRDTPLEDAAGDYRRCIEGVYPFADYLTLNLSSPNTPGLQDAAVRGVARASAGTGQGGTEPAPPAAMGAGCRCW